LLITIFGDLFRRNMSGLGKTLWVIVLLVLPYLGVFIYVISQGRGMAQRQNERSSKRATICAKSLASVWPMSSRNSKG
jgi:Phospholipase_D-nuclease N-terminal